MKLKYEFAIQRVGSGYVAVAINEDADKFKGMIKLNETGKCIFELLAKDTSEEDVVAFILEKFDGNPSEIEKSVKAYLALLKEKNLLI